MADFEKVYQLDFDTTRAIQKLKALETRVGRFEQKFAGAFKSARLQKAITTVNARLKTTDTRLRGVVTSLGQFDSATARTSTAVENRFDRINRAIRRVGTAPASASKRVERFLRATQAGASRAGLGLDRMGRKGKAAGDRISAGAKKARANILALGSASRRAGTSLTSMALRASALLGTAAGVRNITQEYLAFDKQMTIAAAKFSKLEPQMAPGTEAFRQYRNEARAAAVDTEHSASGVAAAVDFWAKAGKSAEQAKAAVPITLDFASANTDAAGAALEVGRAGDILSDALGQFKLPMATANELMSSTARVADVMSAAANKANFSAEELFESYKGAGPVLTAVGSDIEETSSLLASMANAGIKGAIAGTHLKMAIANLSAPAAGQQEALDKLGVSIKDSDGNFRGLTSVIRDLNKATEGMGTADKFAVFAKVVGRRAIPSFINLLAEGQEKLDAMTASLRQTGGETARLAEITRKSAENQLKRFWNRVTDIGFKVIEQTDLFGKLGKAMGSVDWDAVSKTISTEVVPALVTAGGVIKNTMWPAVKDTARLLSAVFGPAVRLVSGLFGDLSSRGNGLSKVLAALATGFIAYRTILAGLAALNMVQKFADLTKGILAASVAQGTLNTQAATTNATLAAGVRQFGLLGAAGAVFAAAIGGWTLGTIIHEQLVEPLAKAIDRLQKLKAEIDSTTQEDIENANSAVLGEKKKQADEAIALEKDHQAKLSSVMALTGMGGMGAMGAGVGLAPERTAEVDRLTEYRDRVETQRVIRNQAENIARYEGGVDEGPQTVMPEIIPDYGTGPVTVESAALPTATEAGYGQSINQALVDALQTVLPPQPEDYEAPQSIDAEVATALGKFGDAWLAQEPTLIPQTITGETAPALGGEYLASLAEAQQATLKLAEQRAAEDRDFQTRLLAEQARVEGPRETKIEVGGTTVNMEVHGGDPAEIRRVVTDALDKRDRQFKVSLREAARGATASEF